MNHQQRFSELYCQHHGIEAERFQWHFLRKSLHLHFIPFAWLFHLANRDYFLADLEFVEEVATATEYAAFSSARRGYWSHPANCGFLHNFLNLRISTNRAAKNFRRILPKRQLGGLELDAGSRAPVQL